VAGGKEQVTDKDVLDFVKHFDLPDENLRECITCSLKGGPNNGKLFLTNNYACFYGKKGVLKSDYKKVIPTDEVLDCDTMPGGGVKIVTFGNKKYTLTSFADEERAVRTMQRYIFGHMGNRPLHTAVLNSDFERIGLIVQSDPTKLNDFNREDETPLALAIKKKDEELVRELLKHYKQHSDKANINLQDRRGFSIMHSAVMISDIPDAILLDLIQFDQTDCGIKNQDHTTPLHYFCEKTLSLNCPFIGRELIKKGGSVNAQSKKNGETPLHKAIFNNKVRLMLVEMLLGKGASPNATTSESGDTPLHYAVHLARVDLVETLIRGGADPACKNKAGKTPADLLEENMAKNPSQDLIKIKKTLADVQNLNNLLVSVELESHLMEFIKDELFKPELLVLVDEDRLQNMGISLPGGKQVKFFKEIEVIKARLAKEKEEQEKNAPAPVGPTLTKTASAQEIKANVMAHSQDLTDNFKEKLSEVSGEIDANELEYTKELGAGASGKVYKARWREKEVAVKVLSNVNMDAQIEEFKKEFKIMNAVKSPFMIQFYGASLKPLMMVMEFCARGSLYHVLNDKTLDINWERALNIAIEMANGIAVLHGWDPQIVHRDLKSLNLLVTSDWKIKVADFGLSRFTTGGNMETFKKLCGTFAYCAPEIFGGTSFTDKSDVYSMGMVIWELIIRVTKGHYEQPFSEYKQLQFDFQILVQAAQGLRPTLPDNTPAAIAEVFKKCCDAKPESRPSAKEVVQLLETVKENYKQNQSAWDEVAAKKKG
jgi:ankyrin repeat protein/tRNA A-37 threonylcarbamoyl transferase component Bud32